MENKTGKSEAPNVVVTNAFPSLLQGMGEIQTECSQKLTELIQAVMLNQKAGTLTLTVNVEPSIGETLGFSGVVAIKKPKVKPTKNLMYVNTDDGSYTLHKDNPKQGKLAFREVERTATPIRELEKAPEAPPRAVNQ